MKSRYCGKLIFAWRARRAGSDSIGEPAQLRNLEVRYRLPDAVEISMEWERILNVYPSSGMGYASMYSRIYLALANRYRLSRDMSSSNDCLSSTAADGCVN